MADSTADLIAEVNSWLRDPRSPNKGYSLVQALLARVVALEATNTEKEARIRDDERAQLWSELTRGVYFDSDEDRRMRAAYRERERRLPVLWVRERRVVPVEEPTEPDYVECDAELPSWPYFSDKAVDFYYMRCDLTYPHTEHENQETGATWTDDAASSLPVEEPTETDGSK